MSDGTNSTKVNSELPDEDALGAFAASAFAGPRRRRDKQRGSSQGTSGTAAAGTTGGTPETPEIPPQELAPAAEPRTDAPHVPAPAPAADVTAATAEPTAAPEAPALASKAKPTVAAEPVSTPAPEPVKPPTEVAVRPAVTPVTHTPSPLAERAITPAGPVQVPDLGPGGSRATQCTIMVSANVRDRIAHYQLTKKMETGKEPTNSVVVRRAFLHTKRNDLFGALLTVLHHRQNPVEDEDYDDDGLLGQVVGRRAERGRMKDSQQQSFRPSYQELATYDAFCTAYGFPSRSDFLDACLDEFLPSLPASGRRR